MKSQNGSNVKRMQTDESQHSEHILGFLNMIYEVLIILKGTTYDITCNLAPLYIVYNSSRSIKYIVYTANIEEPKILNFCALNKY